VVVLVALVLLLAAQELHRNSIRFRVPAAAAVVSIPSRELMAATEARAAAVVDHLARAINQLEEQAFPVKAALVAAAILEPTQAAFSAAAAAVVPAPRVEMELEAAQLKPEPRAATAPHTQLAEAA